MTGITEGMIGIRRLLRRYVLWRVEFRWYLFVLLGLPAIELMGAIIVPGALASFDPTKLPALLISYVPFFVITFLLGGPLGEEPGWRGFALLRLQPLHGPLIGSLILGVLWASWHLPLFWSGVWSGGAGAHRCDARPPRLSTLSTRGARSDNGSRMRTCFLEHRTSEVQLRRSAESGSLRNLAYYVTLLTRGWLLSASECPSAPEITLGDLPNAHRDVPRVEAGGELLLH